MDTEHDEPAAVVEAVATLIARRRIDVSANRYTPADAIDDNEIGWPVAYAGTVHLPAAELDSAWTISNRMMHAWA
jgi:hypothetical protein